MMVISSSSSISLPPLRVVVLLLSLLLLNFSSLVVDGTVIINEISDKGTSTGDCDGEDWIELYNSAADDDGEVVDLAAEGYVLYDDKGPSSEDLFSFANAVGFTGKEANDNTTTAQEELVVMQPGDYLVLCTKKSNDVLSPAFGIGGDDTITLAKGYSTAGFEIVSSVGPMPDTSSQFDVTYAAVETDGVIFYNYTATPTPGTANEISEPKTKDQLNAELKARLMEQNDLGTSFFNFDNDGLPVDGGMEDVLDLRLTMTNDDYDYLQTNRTFEVYKPFTSGILTSRDQPDEIIETLTSPGRIRPRGQWSLYIATCFGAPTFPFQIQFSTAANRSQTLFGLEKAYLRTSASDRSMMRDWSYYRMLARFGLPHLRVRKIRLYINDNFQGLYNFMEAADQEYVFARNFPNYDPDHYGLYKIKSAGIGGCHYGDAEIEAARIRLDNEDGSSTSSSTPPYAFERGEHKKPQEVHGEQAWDPCVTDFFAAMGMNHQDAVLAYLRHDEDCAEMLLDEGLVDRDLGPRSMDESMRQLIDVTINRVCYREEEDETIEGTSEAVYTGLCGNNDETGDNSRMMDLVDVDHILKTTAFYAVTLSTDSPVGNGNNYYIFNTGEENTGFAIMAYDFDTAQPVFCGEGSSCNQRFIHWSIVQPTCNGVDFNPLVGPLLSDPELLQKYLGYVGEFVDTVYSNETLIEQMTAHAQSIEEDARADYWTNTMSYNYDMELSPDAAAWPFPPETLPLLPAMKARAEDVKAQVDALAEKSYPRGPFDLGVNGEYEWWESCVDWRSETPMEDAAEGGCPENCMYEGCQMEDWTLPGVCNPAVNKCYHGDADPNCVGITDAERYDGMTNRDDGSETFCFNVEGTPTKVSECPAYTGGCPENCMYEGCHQPGWTIPSFCDKENGNVCVHGNADEKCAGIADLQRYEGMENTEDNRYTFCFFIPELQTPVWIATCPDYVAPAVVGGASAAGDQEEPAAAGDAAVEGNNNNGGESDNKDDETITSGAKSLTQFGKLSVFIVNMIFIMCS